MLFASPWDSLWTDRPRPLNRKLRVNVPVKQSSQHRLLCLPLFLHTASVITHNALCSLLVRDLRSVFFSFAHSGLLVAIDSRRKVKVGTMQTWQRDVAKTHSVGDMPAMLE